MLKPFLGVLVDVIPIVADEMATVAHAMSIEFGCFVLILWVAGGTTTVANVKPLVINHEGRCYAKVAFGMATITKGDVILSSEL